MNASGMKRDTTSRIQLVKGTAKEGIVQENLKSSIMRRILLKGMAVDITKKGITGPVLATTTIKTSREIIQAFTRTAMTRGAIGRQGIVVVITGKNHRTRLETADRVDRAEQGIYDNKQNFNGYYDRIGGYNNDRYKEDKRNYLRDEAIRSFDKNGGEIYYHREKYHPIIYRNNDHIPSFGYSGYYVDTLPGGYYREDPIVIPRSRDYRYFPHRRRNYDQKLYYPRRGYHEGSYQDNFYDNRRLSKYRNAFHNGYYGF